MRSGSPFVLLIFLAGICSAQDATLTKVTSVEGITEYRLSNGLQVLLFPDDSKPKVTINITYFVGSRHEGYGEAGMAHLLEHMAFKGTPTYPDVPKELVGRGAEPVNGTTWLDRTNYYEGLPATAANLEFGIRFEADRMINSFIAEKDLRSEMTVVRSEFESGEDSPPRILLQRMMAAAFEWHNYGKVTIGNRADIERVPIKNLKRFYEKYYQPDNAMLVVAGNFDEAKAKEHIIRYFGAIPRPERELPRGYTEEPAQDGERLVTLRRVGTVGAAGCLYHVPSGPHPEAAAISVLQTLLTSAPSGRLYRKLVQTRRAAGVSGSLFSLHDPGVLFFLAQAAAGSEPEPILEGMLEVTEGFADDPVTQAEVDRAKQTFRTQRQQANANSSELAIGLSEWAAQGDWRLYFLHRDRMEAVTTDQVQAVAEKYLVRNNRTMGLFIPTESAERVGIPETPSLAKMLDGYKGREVVASGEAFEPTPENIERRTKRSVLPSGIKVALLPKETRGDTVNLRLNLRYGDKSTLSGREKAAELLPEMMMRGTEDMSRQEIRDAFSKLGARVSVVGQPSVVAVQIQTTRDNLGGVLDLLKRILREPVFPEKELETIKTQQVAGLTQQKSQPGALASVLVREKLNPYPKGDPRYAATIDEEIERTKRITTSDLRNLYLDLVNGQNGELTIVGDFDPELAVSKVRAIVEDWTSETKYVRLERLGNYKLEGKLSIIQTPDKANATYMAGMSIPLGQSDEAYPALVIGNLILGGDPFTSRLGARVRQSEGLSYRIGSQFTASPYEQNATMFVFAISAPQNGEKLRAAIRGEIQRLLKDGITQEELERARQMWLQRQTLTRSADPNLAGLLEQTSRTGRSMQFLAKLEQAAEALTVDDVNAALRKYVDPKRLYVVHAGDFSGAATEEKD